MPTASVNEQREIASKLKISVQKIEDGQDSSTPSTGLQKPKVTLMGKSTKKPSRLSGMRMGMKLDIQSVTSDILSLKKGLSIKSTDKDTSPYFEE
jgi:hypothetical protein